MKLIFASNNKHKIEEIRSVSDGKIEIVSMKEAGIDIDIPEPYDTLEENARNKAMTVYSLTGKDCFSEDTGLEVQALNGEPGVKSARYAGEDKSFEKNIEKLLAKLGDTNHRKARFRAAISLILNGKEYRFEGITEGSINRSPIGHLGFGYDPLFVPEGEKQTFAQMTLEEKNRYSHRLRAFSKMVAFLQIHSQSE